MAGDLDGPDGVEGVLATEIAPPTRPRDQAGKFVRETSKPEPMFVPREVEGDPLTGDTRDGGDNPRLRAREREVANGRFGETTTEEEGQDRQRRSPARRQERNNADADDGHELYEQEPEFLTADRELEAAEGEELQSREREHEQGDERYEVTIDGEQREVTLDEALAGYIRQETFHKRMSNLNEIQQNMHVEADRLSQGWALWQKARADYEEDLINLMPKEPNWDEEFARDPRAAHANQKVYQILYQKLADSRNQRAQREAAEKEVADRRLEKYAVDGFAKFVSMHPKTLPDEAALKKNLMSMRRTGADAGFTDYEVATVYDPRMLTVLLWASKFRRMIAARPRAVVPEQGRTLGPGSATPSRGNASRKGLDEAQRQLASSGRLDDAAEVFRRIL